MADLILHHYATSPFSEKLRLIMGYKKLAWKSVIIPQILPKPDLVALTGGYRKTPVLQIGVSHRFRGGRRKYRSRRITAIRTTAESAQMLIWLQAHLKGR